MIWDIKGFAKNGLNKRKLKKIETMVSPFHVIKVIYEEPKSIPVSDSLRTVYNWITSPTQNFENLNVHINQLKQLIPCTFYFREISFKKNYKLFDIIMLGFTFLAGQMLT